MQKLHYHKIVLILFLLAAGSAVAQGRHGHDMPGARKGLNAVVLGDKIWILGGSRRMHDQLNTVDIYDPALDRWQSSGTAFQHARENATAQVYNDKIYLFGGRRGNKIISQVEMFDPNAGHWQTVTHMPSPRFGLTSVIVDSTIWLIGGTPVDNTSSVRVDVYYPGSNRWERLDSDLNTGRSSAMAASIDDKIFVFGGFYFGPIAGYEHYEPDPGQWQSVGDMPAPMAGSGYASDSSLMWLAGGMSSGGRSATVMQFNGTEWISVASLSRAKSECAAVFYENKLYVFGGQSGHTMGGSVENTVEIFAVTTSVQQPVDQTPERFALISAYPNPFSVKTTIEISLPQQDQGDIWIYDIRGRLVRRLYHGLLPRGQQTLVWTAVDASGARLPAGTYIVRLQGERFQHTKKIFILH